MGARKVQKVLVFIGKKYPKAVTVGSAITLALYAYSGPLLALASAVLTLLYMVYNFGDILLYNVNTPKDSRTNVLSPREMNLPFEDFFITTEDNVKINAVFIKRPEPEGRQSPTIVYFHGNSGNVGHRLQHVSDLSKHLNCQVLCVEYRGFGRSEGRPSERGLCLDARAGLNYALERPDIDNNKIFVFGRSLGGAVAIDLVANSPNRHRIRALVVENTFTTLPNIARKLFPIMEPLSDWMFKNQWRSIDKVAKITVPVLFLSGLSDETVPPMMMTSLYNQCASTRKELAKFPLGNHKLTYKCDHYYPTVIKFFEAVLPQETCAFHKEPSE